MTASCPGQWWTHPEFTLTDTKATLRKTEIEEVLGVGIWNLRVVGSWKLVVGNLR